MSNQFLSYYQPDKKDTSEETDPDGFPQSRGQKRVIGFAEPEKRSKKQRRQRKEVEGFQAKQREPLKQQVLNDEYERPRPERKSAQLDGEQPKKPRKRWFKRIAWTLFTLIFITILGMGWVGWKFFNTTTKVFGGTPVSNAIKMFQPTTLKSGSAGHVNILVAGNSVDDPNHGGADLTDSIMILSINTDSKQAYMFSIPRDLWVDIPDEGHHKINEAYHWGKEANFQETGYPDGGMGLLEKTIEESFQIPIDYYALVNYAALKNIVNAIDGVDVNIQSSDVRGLYDPNINYADGGPLKLPNGVNHLDGQTALNFARARGDPTFDGRVAYGFPRSDFNRTEHQRQLLTAIQDKMSSAGVLINPFKLGKVLDGVGTNITTDMEINEARKIVGLIRGIGTGNMQSVALASDKKNYLRSYGTPTGQSALIPAAGVDDYSDIHEFIHPLLGSL